MTANPSAIVYVHGISEHQPGYSDDWYTALQPHLSQTVEKYEVLWSNIVNRMAMNGGDDADNAARIAEEEEELRQAVHEELEARRSHNRQKPEVDTANNAAMAQGFAIDDFFRYMVREDTRNAILKSFDEVVVPLLSEGRTIHIIAHSWGTVVSYEGLRRLDDDGLPGRVANLIVLGSALSFDSVQANLFGRVTNGLRPSLVDNFVNIDAGGDVVGGPIAPPFENVNEFMERVPTGCSMFWFRRLYGHPTARNPACAHRSYFQHENTAVQRDIIAHYINPSLA